MNLGGQNNTHVGAVIKRALVYQWKGQGQHLPSHLLCSNVPFEQDPGFPEGATHGWEVDQCHQGDPGGHQERDPAERLLRLTR